MKPEIGERFTEISSHPPTDITHKIYKEQTPILVELIKRQFPTPTRLHCLDFGGGNGALSKDITEMLPEYDPIFTNVDQSEELLAKDSTATTKICSRLEDFDTSPYTKPIFDLFDKDQQIGSPHPKTQSPPFNLVVMRYVLQYNEPQTQVKILKNIRECIKKPGGLFILQHVGALNRHHIVLLNQMFSGSIVEKLVRATSGWSTWEDTEERVKNVGANIEIARRFCLPNGNFFQTRYDLTDEEERTRREFLGSYDLLEYVIAAVSLK